MKTVRYNDESRESPNEPDGLNKGWKFNGDNCGMGMPRQQSGSVAIIWGGMIGNELIGPLCVPKELKLSSDTYCSFLKTEAQLKKIIFLRDHFHA